MSHTRRTGLSLAAVIVGLCALACEPEQSTMPGDQAKAGPAGGCSDAIVTICTAYAGEGLRCDGTTQAEHDAAVAKCQQETGDTLSLSCAYAQGLSSCLSTNDCATSDDRCVWEGFIAAAPPGWDIPTMRSCLSKTITDEATCRAAIGGNTRLCLNRLEACIGGPYAGAENPPYTDDNCYSLAALTTEASDRAVECLTLPCDEIVECLHNVGTFNY